MIEDTLLPPSEYEIDQNQEITDLLSRIHENSGDALAERQSGQITRYVLPALLANCQLLEQRLPPLQELLRKK